MTFEEYAKREGFPLNSTQKPLWRKCWETAQVQVNKDRQTFTLAEIKNGTGFAPGARFIMVEPE